VANDDIVKSIKSFYEYLYNQTC